MKSVFVVFGKHTIQHEGSEDYPIVSFTEVEDAEKYQAAAETWRFKNRHEPIEQGDNPWDLNPFSDYGHWADVVYYWMEVPVSQSYQEPNPGDYYRYAK